MVKFNQGTSCLNSDLKIRFDILGTQVEKGNKTQWAGLSFFFQTWTISISQTAMVKFCWSWFESRLECFGLILLEPPIDPSVCTVEEFISHSASLSSIPSEKPDGGSRRERKINPSSLLLKGKYFDLKSFRKQI